MNLLYLLSIGLLGGCLLSYEFYVRVPYPYMDEPFHIPQTQRYCAGNWTEWDPKITTLPGLYLAGVSWIYTLSTLLTPLVRLGVINIDKIPWGYTVESLCSSALLLRSVNLLFAIGNFFLFRRITRELDPTISPHESTKRAIVLSLFPLLFFFNFLYYTDPGSTFFVLLMYLYSLQGKIVASSMAGVCSILFRQTNIIWAFFCCATSVERKYRASTQPRESSDPGEILPFVKYVFQNLVGILCQFWPFILLAIGFVAFVFINGGIVVGDRTAHAAVINFGQLMYFLATSLSFALLDGFTVTPTTILQFLKQIFEWIKKPSTLVALVLSSLVCLLLIREYSPVHPYMLADNRHYTFYIWKNIFRRFPNAKYYLLPAYAFAGWTLWTRLRKKENVLWILFYIFSTTAVLLPALLWEVRYSLLPFLFFKLHSPWKGTLLQSFSFGIINAITIYVFLYRPYVWDNGEARFMW